MEEARPFSDLIYNALIATSSVGSGGRRGIPWEWRRGVVSGAKTMLWRTAWRRATERYVDRPVRARVHGKVLQLNFGHPYPLNVQMYETYNAPLVELVIQTAQASGRPAVVLDVGAGVGDTAALLARKCLNSVAEIIAIEGGHRTFEFLRENLSRIGIAASALRVLVSDKEGPVPSLVPVHRGTASLVGDGQVDATTLDALISGGMVARPDVIKIDVDGFDGRVLAGSRQMLTDHHPSVIFEWSPQHLMATGNPRDTAFEVLAKCDYTKFLWFDKFGRFALADDVPTGRSLTVLEEICVDNSDLPDWHFDVIALPDDCQIPLPHLAGLNSLDSTRQARSSLLRWWQS